MEKACQSLHGAKPFLRLAELGSKRARDVGIHASVDQVKKFSSKKLRKIDENYDNELKKNSQ